MLNTNTTLRIPHSVISTTVPSSPARLVSISKSKKNQQSTGLKHQLSEMLPRVPSSSSSSLSKTSTSPGQEEVSSNCQTVHKLKCHSTQPISTLFASSTGKPATPTIASTSKEHQKKYGPSATIFSSKDVINPLTIKSQTSSSKSISPLEKMEKESSDSLNYISPR